MRGQPTKAGHERARGAKSVNHAAHNPNNGAWAEFESTLQASLEGSPLPARELESQISPYQPAQRVITSARGAAHSTRPSWRAAASKLSCTGGLEGDCDTRGFSMLPAAKPTSRCARHSTG